MSTLPAATNARAPLLAVLIDADNMPAKYAEAVLKEAATIGEPALRRVYGDWSSDLLKSWVPRMRELGLVAHQASANTKGKNASDIQLVIDAMDILHSGRFDGFLLVSSDSDFTALANRLRENGQLVIGIGEKKAPESLRNVCNRFIFIENIYEGTADGPQRPAKEEPRNAIPLVLEAMQALEQDDEWYPLGQVGQTIMAAHPDFDTRTYGVRKLSDLVGKLARFETRPRRQSPLCPRQGVTRRERSTGAVSTLSRAKTRDLAAGFEAPARWPGQPDHRQGPTGPPSPQPARTIGWRWRVLRVARGPDRAWRQARSRKRPADRRAGETPARKAPPG